MKDPTKKKRRYDTPRIAMLDREQASVMLVGLAWNGNKQARDLLNTLFPEPGPAFPIWRIRANGEM